MIQISVRNFRGCASADIGCSSISLLAGQNGAGKSSVAQAVAACLTGNAIAKEFGVLKKDIKVLMRRGAKAAQAVLKGDDGSAEITWPEGKLATLGNAPPQASLFAAGLRSIATLPPAERAAELDTYLHAVPTREDLAAAMADDFDDPTIEAVWGLIQRDGWDKAHTDRIEARKRAGNAWEGVTGETFGSSRARDWRPEGWDEILADIDIKQLEGNVETERLSLEAAIAGMGADQGEIDRLRGIVAELDKRVAAEAAAKEQLAAAAAAAAAANERLAAVPDTESMRSGMACPHCGGIIVLHREGPRTTLKKHESVPADEMKKIQLEHASAAGAVENTRHNHQQAQAIYARAQAALDDAYEAKNKIAGMGAGRGSAAQVDAARDRHARAQRDLVMFEKVTDATNAYQRWEDNNKIADTLSPKGLRARKLAETLGAWNDTALAPLCEIAEWGTVKLDDEFGVWFGETPYALSCASEQFRARITLQVAMAKQDGSGMLVIDGADMLVDPKLRNGLIELLAEAGIPALVCMAIGAPNQVPNLDKADLGSSFWIARGRAAPLAEALA